MRVYIKRSLLNEEDTKKIEAWAQHLEGTTAQLNRVLSRLNHLRSERHNLETGIAEMEARVSKVKVDKYPITWSDDEGTRQWQEREREADYQRGLAAAKKPYLEKAARLRLKLEEWKRRHLKELEQAESEQEDLSRRKAELENKLSPFVAIEISELI